MIQLSNVLFFRFGQLHFHLDALSHLQVKLSSVVNNKSHNKLFCEFVVCTLSRVVCFAIFGKINIKSNVIFDKKNSKLTNYEALWAYRTVFLPSISYPLGAIYFSPDQCSTLQNLAAQAYLPKLGFNCNDAKIVNYPPIFFKWG